MLFEENTNCIAFANVFPFLCVMILPVYMLAKNQSSAIKSWFWPGHCLHFAVMFLIFCAINIKLMSIAPIVLDTTFLLPTQKPK